MDRSRTFRLTRYLSLTSLLGVLIAAIVLGQLYRGFAKAQITATAERHNLELAQYLAAGIWPEYGAFLTGLGDMDGGQIRSQPKLQALHQRMLKQLRDSRIVKVKFFDSTGLTVYSSELDQIGKRKSGYTGFEQALLGETTSLVSYRDSVFSHADNVELRNRELLSSYAPVRGDDDRIVAAVELYNDITPLMAEINGIQAQLVGATVVVMLILYSTLFYNIRRAEGIIREKARAHAEHERRMQHQANHDALTGLPNRRHFRHLLGERMALAEQHEHLLAVLFVDLDRFKPINDTLGHQAGDELLKLVAERLIGSCRDHDVVSRIGGDEFTVILDRLGHIRDVENAARRLLDSISQPLQLAGKELSVGASIGIAVYPFDDEDLDALIKHADTAMYAAKEAGRNRYLYYADDMNTASMQRLELERDLRNALRLDQLELHYQPRFCLSSRRVIGVEALLRWRHPELGMVPPDVFIPAAEETGLIQSLGNWVLHTGCVQIAALSRQLQRPIVLSLNVSARQLSNDSFHDEIGRALDASGLSAGHLELELTESTLMQNCEDAVATLAGIKDTGVAIALDDFGTGYSSLSYLKRLPLDTLKIDRSFIGGVTDDARDAALTASIVDIGRRLGLRVVAEGIETDEQLAFVRSSGCDEAQGYLIARPMPLHELSDFLRADAERLTG